jgi:hypothetical protein
MPINFTQVILAGIDLLNKYPLPPSSPPPSDKIDVVARYKQLMADQGFPLGGTPPVTIINVPTEVVEGEVTAPKQIARQATGCLDCSRAHLSAASGSLSEALRFAREGGIEHPEVQRRINLAEDEITIMERIDLAPDALENSPEPERHVAEEFLPHIRKLRQDLGQISNVDKLQQSAAEASEISKEFRIKQHEIMLNNLKEKGVNLDPIMDLAQQVRAGKITIEEAREKVRQLIPQEVEESGG